MPTIGCDRAATVESDPWEKIEEWSETAFTSPIVTVEAVNAVYEDPAFLDQFRPLLPDNIEQTGSKDLRLRGGRTAKAFQYDADYPLSGAALGVPSGNPVLKIRVWAALWPTTGSFEMTGGIYPLEDLSEAVARVDGQTDRTCETRPGTDRRDVLDRIREAAE